VLRADDVTLTVKLGEGQFPPYDQVIPKENDKILVIEREVLLDALRRVSSSLPTRPGESGSS